ncbi:uncharacterized protein LOC107423513 [Ziziphus jujuba]|uniref:Uncharacterized protein LOC107423513 n=1 Tax=Ziziphus jujuba TaxID=326968 RepID=A0A6P4A467_ZIZJJ|nr:uncharacterized protein LOC107423513 [Ziziphus jujuba]
MGYMKNSMVMCPINEHCLNWVRKYMGYCLCSVRDGVSLGLGFLSVVSWTVAEVPQIITNYKQKSAEGLSMLFLITWLIGDLFNLFGCMLEPATLPTQFYMAVLYTVTTMILAGQSVYYVHIYPQLKYSRQQQKGAKFIQTEVGGKFRPSCGINVKEVNNAQRSDKFDTAGRENAFSSPIPLPSINTCGSPGRDLYYVSARSLSRSHTPTAGSVLAQKTPPSHHFRNSTEEPLLSPALSTQSASPSNVKTLLSVVSAMTFLGTWKLHRLSFNLVPENPNHGVVIRVGRKLLQASSGLLLNNGIEGSSGIGNYLGWGMAAIYMGGRLPQIFLNIKKGNVEGLNPLMFVFALVGNATYVASILVNSLDWSKIGPNLPWLVDAGGCVLLDTFILLQFIYFRYSKQEDDIEDKNGHFDAV